MDAGAYFAAQGVCMVCRQREMVRNEEARLRQLLNHYRKMTAAADKKDRMEQEKRLRKDPGLCRLFYSSHKCRYGMHCTKVSLVTLQYLSGETSKLFILAEVMGKRLRDETALAGYPKVRGYIMAHRR